MAVRTTITGAAWATSGAATAGSTGLNATSGFTHVGSTDIPAGSAATGYLQAASGASASFKVDATAAGTSGVRYTVNFWFRAVVIDPTLASLSDQLTGDMHSFSFGGTTILERFLLIKSATDVQNLSGLIIFPRITAGGGVPVDERMLAAGLSGGTTRPNVPFSRWVNIGIGINPGVAGETPMYVNGQCINKYTAVDTTALNAATLDDFTITFPAWTGFQWQVCGDIQTWDGAGNTILTQAPSANTNQFCSPSNYDKAWLWTPRWADDSEGASWKKLSGTLPVSVPNYYSLGGLNTAASRQVFTATGAAQTAVLESKRSIGTLQFNAEGWSTIYFKDICLTGSASGSSIKLALRNSGNSADVMSFTFSQNTLTATDATFGAVNIPIAFVAGNHYGLDIILNSDGRRQLFLHNLTDAAVGTAVYDVADMCQHRSLPVWGNQALGPIQVSLTLNANLDTCEFGPVSCERISGKVGVDSYTQGLQSGATPAMTTGLSNMGQPYLFNADCEAGALPGKFIPTSGPVYAFNNALGWSGKTMARFYEAAGRQIKGPPGQRLIIFGGIANDTSAASTLANAIIAGRLWASRIVNIIKGVISSESYADIYLPIWGSGLGGAFAPEMIAEARAEFRRQVAKFDSQGRLRVLYTQSPYLTTPTYSADGLHPNAAGQALWAAEIQTNAKTVPYAGGSGDIRPWVR